MKYQIDGDQMMICADSFVNLQESPVIFIPLDGELAKAILAESSEKDDDDKAYRAHMLRLEQAMEAHRLDNIRQAKAQIDPR